MKRKEVYYNVKKAILDILPPLEAENGMLVLFDDERGKAVLSAFDVIVMPKKSVERIEMKCIITSTGIEFSDLVND